MKKLIALLLLMPPLLVHASGVEVKLKHVDIDLADNETLKRGAQHYVEYCLGCHSSKHIRYSRIAKDLKMTKQQVLELAPAGAGIYDSMISAMDPNDAKQWFNGAPAPDLSLIARSRGPEWLYTYLHSFHVDDKKPMGSNNLLFKDVSMPNVLYELQGRQELTFSDLGKTRISTGLKITEVGALSAQEFEQFTRELVTFLVYVGEPSKLERLTMGKYVLLFILLFIFVAYLLKKEYWKDIH